MQLWHTSMGPDGARCAWYCLRKALSTHLRLFASIGGLLCIWWPQAIPSVFVVDFCIVQAVWRGSLVPVTRRKACYLPLAFALKVVKLSGCLWTMLICLCETWSVQLLGVLRS